MSFRQQNVQRLLYQCGLWWQETAEQLLQRLSGLGYSKELFQVWLDEVDLTSLTPFYTSVLEASQGLKLTRDSAASPGRWLLEEPLLHNNFIISQMLSFSSLCCALQRAGCLKLGHLLHDAGTCLGGLAQRMDIRSTRILGRLVKEVCASLPGPAGTYVKSFKSHEQWDDGGPYRFPALTVAPVVGEWQEEKDKLLTFITPNVGSWTSHIGEVADISAACQSVSSRLFGRSESVEVDRGVWPG